MGARFSAPVHTGLGSHPAFCTMGTAFFPGVQSGWDVTLTPHPLLVPWSRKSRAIPLIPLWAVRPVQSLSACTRVHFTFLPLAISPAVFSRNVPYCQCHITLLPLIQKRQPLPKQGWYLCTLLHYVTSLVTRRQMQQAPWKDVPFYELERPWIHIWT